MGGSFTNCAWREASDGALWLVGGPESIGQGTGVTEHCYQIVMEFMFWVEIVYL